MARSRPSRPPRLEEQGIPPKQARSVLDALWEGGVVLTGRPASATP
ncbi:MAG: hypothetical protein MUF64_14290 [Polyangiaceae bacterium]|nr:hypothetical protein [Polyangiaceae bacterium]